MVSRGRADDRPETTGVPRGVTAPCSSCSASAIAVRAAVDPSKVHRVYAERSRRPRLQQVVLRSQQRRFLDPGDSHLRGDRVRLPSRPVGVARSQSDESEPLLRSKSSERSFEDQRVIGIRTTGQPKEEISRLAQAPIAVATQILLGSSIWSELPIEEPTRPYQDVEVRIVIANAIHVVSGRSKRTCSIIAFEIPMFDRDTVAPLGLLS